MIKNTPIAYRVIVEEVRLIQTTKKEYQLLEKRPLTKEEAQTSYKSELAQVKEVYGYAAPIEITEEKAVRVFDQTIDSDIFDLLAVVMAANGCKAKEPAK